MPSENEDKSFFLGISGEPAGPFTLQEVRIKLARGDINRQTLIWYKGLTEWQPIDDITFFENLNPESSLSSITEITDSGAKTGITKDDFLSPTAYSPADDEAPVAPERSASQDATMAPTTFSPKGAKPKAVFNKQEAVFNKRALSPWLKVGIGTVAIVLISWMVSFYFGASPLEKGDEIATNTANRKIRLEAAKENLVLNPALGIAELRRLIVEKVPDETHAQAAQALELHYWTKKDYRNLGDLMLLIGQPFRAAEFYLQPPPLYDSAATAYKYAFDSSTDPKDKKRALLASIQLLLNHLNKKPEALAQIKLFQTTFPKEPNPFDYYLLPTEQQIIQVFSQVSHEFLASLNSYFEGEFPQLKLIQAPKVEIHKENGKYRITGTYQGELKLNQDRLKGIFMHLWFQGDHWFLVETNITPDRKKFSEKNKQQLLDKALDTDSILPYLESIRNQLVRQTAGQNSRSPNLSMKNIPGQ